MVGAMISSADVPEEALPVEMFRISGSLNPKPLNPKPLKFKDPGLRVQGSGV